MTTYADLGAQLLRDAAAFFRTIAEQNEPLREQMNANAEVFDEVAHFLETNPTGDVTEGGFGMPHDHEGGCCGGHHHHHEDDEGHEHDHDHAEKSGCGGKGQCKH